MSAESVLREAVDDHRRELAALRARVKELEEALSAIVNDMDGERKKMRDGLKLPIRSERAAGVHEMERYLLCYLYDAVDRSGARRALHRPTPSQERP